MFVVEIDSSRRFVVISVAGHVTVEEARDTAQRVRDVLVDAEPGFVALADFRWLDSMATGAAEFIAEIMDAFAAKKVSAVVRVVPDPPQVPMMHLLLATTQGGFTAAARRLAAVERIWTWPDAMTTADPATVRVELSVGDATCALAPDEVRDIVAALVAPGLSAGTRRGAS